MKKTSYLPFENAKKLSDEDCEYHTRCFLESRDELEDKVLEDDELRRDVSEWINVKTEHDGAVKEFSWYLSNGGQKHLKECIDQKNNPALSNLFDLYRKERDTLLLHFMSMVISRAKHYATNGGKLNPDRFWDLISEGQFGVIRGLENYDEQRSKEKVKFSTYIFRCISNAILDYMRMEKRATRASKGKSIYDFSDLLPEEKTQEDMENTELKWHVLDNLKSALDEKEFALIQDYYGLDGKPQVDPKIIAQKLNTSYEAIRVRKCKIMKKLSTSFKKLVA